MEMEDPALDWTTSATSYRRVPSADDLHGCHSAGKKGPGEADPGAVGRERRVRSDGHGEMASGRDRDGGMLRAAEHELRVIDLANLRAGQQDLEIRPADAVRYR